MTQNPEFLDYILDMIDAIEKAQSFVSNVTFEDFIENHEKNFAVTRALEIVGEASKRIPDQIRNQYPDIPWKEMAGMRDRIIHGYGNVNLMIVWETVKNRIPIIKPELETIMKTYSSPGENE